MEQFGVFHVESKPVARMAPAKADQQKSAFGLETSPVNGFPEAFLIRRREPIRGTVAVLAVNRLEILDQDSTVERPPEQNTTHFRPTLRDRVQGVQHQGLNSVGDANA